MSNWKQKIEAQIVVTDARGDYINQHSSVDSNMHYDSAETMRLLLDVVVAAEYLKGHWLESPDAAKWDNALPRLFMTLDKLRAALERIAEGCDLSNEAQAIARDALNLTDVADDQ